MSVFDRIGKMADMALQEAASKLDLHERGGGHSRNAGHGGHDGASRGIAELEERYEEALQRTIELRQQSVDAEEMAQLRAEQAELAMRAGDEELARMALQEKLRLEAACAQYRAQYASSQDVCLALADELAVLRAGRAAGAGQPRSGLSKEEAREALRELEATGRELGREALQGLRVAGRVSKETLKEAGSNLKQEMRKLQQDWRDKK
ncbi:PspA/IM30 family protein [Paenibacillus sp. MAH-36]|uniref:PspA/IM30 family protein n=1 Tax=Paenibacillus violae TaxID=3077234 RepID=A0ABU3RFC8_9BACL|nr:hypothetical protein [Paenibacillus sp. PFR10]MDU0202946.1 hypothetical protein [Paenibacillus sp. PFR10]